MVTFARAEDLQGAEFVGANLRGARFVEADLSTVVMRGVEVTGMDIDAPWLVHGDGFFRQRRRRHPVRRGRAEPPLPRPRRPPGRGPGRSARGLGRARAHLGGDAGARRGDAGRHGRRVGGRRVVVRADAAAPGPRHGHLAAPRDPAGRAAVPPARSLPVAGCRGRRAGPVDLHNRDPVVRRGARGPGRARRDGARLPGRRDAGCSWTWSRKNPWAPAYPETVAPACT